jgi:hypothetical protein
VKGLRDVAFLLSVIDRNVIALASLENIARLTRLHEATD